MQRTLISIGVLFFLAGLFWPYIAKSKLGRLPGDIFLTLGPIKFYAPLATCLLLSVILSLLFWLLNR